MSQELVRFYVWYDAGSCNDGSHTSGLEEFDTEAEARRWIDANRGTLIDGGATIIRGVVVGTFDGEKGYE